VGRCGSWKVGRMSRCDDGLRVIGRAIGRYQAENGGRNPAEVGELVVLKWLSPWDLVCPPSGEAVGGCSYVYRGGDLGAESPGELVLLYDRRPVHKGRRNILFADGRVERRPEGVFESVIRKDNELRGQLGLAEIGG